MPEMPEFDRMGAHFSNLIVIASVGIDKHSLSIVVEKPV
jgi:hypothetical protein